MKALGLHSTTPRMNHDRFMDRKIDRSLFAFFPSGLTIFAGGFQNEGACHAEGANE